MKHQPPDPEFLDALPTDPGVYLMKGAEGEIIYIGKALNLRSRVRSYFNQSGDNRFSVRFLRQQVATVDVVVTATDKEAFLLENTLIKQHLPRYNIRLRDDKTYVSLRLRMDHAYPRLEVARVRGTRGAASRPGDLTFGPYTSSSSVRETLKFLLRIFPVRTCKDSVFRNRTRPCVLYDVGKCCGPCVLPVPKEEYAGLVRQVAQFLRGRGDAVRKLLRQKMAELSENMEYERAAIVRDRLQAMDITLESQQTAGHDRADIDIIAASSERGRTAVVVQQVRGGSLLRSEVFHLKNYEHTDAEVLYSIVSQHYELADPPPEVLVSVEPADAGTLRDWLRDRRGAAVDLRVPQRGQGVRRMELAEANARQELERRLAGERGTGEVLSEVARKLGLLAPPQSIECIDISNIMGSLAVGSLVRFAGDKPDKAGYRLFKIRTVEGANDYAMMREVLTRRFRPSDGKPRPAPDLLLLDGGKGQLNVATDVMTELGIRDVPVASIAKTRVGDRTIRTAGGREKLDAAERIFLPGRKNPVGFPHNSPGLYLLQRVRDEAHRFAITYHKRLRQKANRRSILEEVPGVGPRRGRALLRKFGSLAALRKATLEEIAGVGGVGPAAAREVYEYLRLPEQMSAPAKPMDFLDTVGDADTTMESIE